MPCRFFDTSALGKRYHVEVGTPKVNSLVEQVGIVPVISRLTLIEIQSVFAGKVRRVGGVIGTHRFCSLATSFGNSAPDWLAARSGPTTTARFVRTRGQTLNNSDRSVAPILVQPSQPGAQVPRVALSE
jgi:hypothetical protein